MKKFRSKPKACACHGFVIGHIRNDVDAFVAGAADPANPRCCPLCIFARITHVFLFCDVLLDDVKTERASLLSACLSLLHAFASAPALHIRRCLNAAARRCTKNHDYPLTDTACYEEFVGCMLALLFTAIEKGSRPIHRYPLTSKDAHWPKTVDDLVPHGAAADMEALVHWCCVLPTHPPFGVLFAYVQAIPNVVLPPLLESPLRQRLAWAMATALSRTPVQWPGGTPFDMPDGIKRDTRQCGTPVVANYVMLVVYMIHGQSDHGADELFQLVAGFERAFLGPVAALGGALRVLHPGAAGMVRPFVDFLNKIDKGHFEDPVAERPTSRLAWEFFNLTDRKYSVCRTVMVLKQKIDLGRCDWGTFKRLWVECDLDAADILRLRAWLLASGVFPAFTFTPYTQ
ncbi:hypothetical protein AURDEDRAFT_129644 [Auricularia subglabra TFB-10046 SS5]|nr:hypothetical protein AURDEDRAFT_129644 [Auricularia subglabra TFB-10046 SS5]